MAHGLSSPLAAAARAWDERRDCTAPEHSWWPHWPSRSPSLTPPGVIPVAVHDERARTLYLELRLAVFAVFR